MRTFNARTEPRRFDAAAHMRAFYPRSPRRRYMAAAATRRFIGENRMSSCRIAGITSKVVAETAALYLDWSNWVEENQGFKIIGSPVVSQNIDGTTSTDLTFSGETMDPVNNITSVLVADGIANTTYLVEFAVPMRDCEGRTLTAIDRIQLTVI